VSGTNPTVVGLIVRRPGDGSDTLIAGTPTIEYVRQRLAQVAGLGSAIVVDVDGESIANALRDRAWSTTAWRGGIGGATIYDELIDPGKLGEAIDQASADAALIVGAGWPLVDAKLCSDVMERYRGQTEHKMVFTQAAPGFCGLLIARELLGEMAEHGATVGRMLGYHPAAPQADPIGRDVCVAVPPTVRDAPLRATADAPRWLTLIESALRAGKAEDAAAAATCMTDTLRERGHALPGQIGVELTTRRRTSGPVVPISQIDVERPDMTAATLDALLAGVADDIALSIGGLGDPLCHPEWSTLRERLAGSGAAGVAIETDLLCDEGALPTLDGFVVKVRFNADSAGTYQQLMGVDGFDRALKNMQWLLEKQPGSHLVPAFVKCRDNVHEMESFYDRWLRLCGTAVVEGPPTGAGLIDDIGVLDMAPPKRFACRQLLGRMTVLSDGTVPRCDQDWLGRVSVGKVNEEALAVLWGRIQDVRREHERGEFGGICEGCRSWFRP